MNKGIKTIIDEYDNITILSGAGVSTMSGIPDFRGISGLYTNDTFKGYPIQEILTRRFNNKHRNIFWEYMNKEMSFKNSKPNKAHYFAKNLEEKGKLISIITQNIDGLYQKTGISTDKIIEIHGHTNYVTCVKCKTDYNLSECKLSKKGNYLCPKDGFIVDTNVILYGDTFKQEELDKYWKSLSKTDLLIIMGTRLDIMFHMDTTIRFNGDICLINNEDIKLESYEGMREWDMKFIGDLNILL